MQNTNDNERIVDYDILGNPITARQAGWPESEWFARETDTLVLMDGELDALLDAALNPAKPSDAARSRRVSIVTRLEPNPWDSASAAPSASFQACA